MEKKYYHGSSDLNLKELTPRISTHGIAWVYATTNPVLAAFFSARLNDFSVITEIDQNQVVNVWELYEGAFNEKCKGKKTALYELEDSGFLSNQTSFKAEVVSPNKTRIISTLIIDDIGKYLKQKSEEGLIKIHFYENTPKYQAMVKEHICDRLVRFNMMERPREMLPDVVKQHWIKFYDELKSNIKGK